MNFRLTLVALIILLAIGGIFFYTQSHQTKEETPPIVDKTLFSPKPETIAKLSLKREDGVTVAFEKTGSAWNMTSPVKQPAETSDIEGTAEEIAGLNYDDKFAVEKTGDHSTAAMGLDQPSMTLNATDGKGVSHELDLGKRVASGGIYAQDSADKNQAYVIETGWLDKLNKDPSEYRSRDIADISPDNIAEIKVASGTQTVDLIKKDGKWAIDQPIPARANQTAVSDFLQNGQGLRADSISSVSKKLSAAGFSPPRLTVTFSETPAATATTGPASAPAATQPAGKSVTLEFGGYADLEKKRVFISIPGNDTVFTVVADRFNKFNKDLNSLRDPAVTPVATGDATEIQIDRLAQADQPAAQISLKQQGAIWQMATPYGVKADAVVVNDLLSGIQNLRANKFVDGAGDKKSIGLEPPQETITLSLRGQSQREVLFIGKAQAAEPLTPMMRQGDPTVYLVQSHDLDKLLPKALELRDTTVVNFPTDALRTIQATGPETAANHAAVNLSRQDKNWKTTAKEGTAVDVDNLKVTELLAELNPVTAKRWIDPNGNHPQEAALILTITADEEALNPTPALATQTAGPKPPTAPKTATRTISFFKNADEQKTGDQKTAIQKTPAAPQWSAVYDSPTGNALDKWSFEPTDKLMELLTTTNFEKSATTAPATAPAPAGE